MLIEVAIPPPGIESVPLPPHIVLLVEILVLLEGCLGGCEGGLWILVVLVVLLELLLLILLKSRWWIHLLILVVVFVIYLVSQCLKLFPQGKEILLVSHCHFLEDPAVFPEDITELLEWVLFVCLFFSRTCSKSNTLYSLDAFVICVECVCPIGIKLPPCGTV